MFRDLIEVKNNVRIVARERGKKVRSLCREGHNIWTNLGRQYLAEVVSPVAGYSAHYNDSPLRVIRYLGLGIGGDSQMPGVDTTFPLLAAHYPGRNIFNDTDLTVQTLERPVKVSGSAGTGIADGIWMSGVTAPPTFGGTPVTKVEFDTLFDYPDLQLGGAYPSVPLSEIAMILSSEEPSKTSEEVYDYGNPPSYIASTRQKLVAYNTFDPISKTVSVALEVYWELQF